MAEVNARVVLTARGLGKDFAGFTAVNNVDLDVRHAQIHALIGPNGAGKTTVFNLLTKFLPPTRGRIELLGNDITHTGPAKVARMGLVRSFQISAVFPHLSVRENVKVALQRPAGLATQFWRPLSALDRLNDRADELIDRLGLGTYRDHRAADLSYGRKRVLEIATTLALDPEVLLLDEPMAGMGREDVAMVAGIIRDLAADRAVLMVEHNLSVVADICDHVTVLQR
ncbi:ABC transporter ATP-binding protein, partial [Paracoccus caeni]